MNTASFNKTKVKIGIFAAALLMMGAIGINSTLSAIALNLNVSELDAIQFVAVTCLTVIPVSIVTGILTKFISKKILLIIGILCFIVGGCAPFFMKDYGSIMGMRILFGVGIGLIQTLSVALVPDYFEGEEKSKTQGMVATFQMIGCIVMSLVGGVLGSIQWNYVFLVHLFGIISLVLVLILLPLHAPKREAPAAGTQKSKGGFTATFIYWVIICFIFFIPGQIFANSMSVMLTQKTLGGPAEAGVSLAVFAVGGIIFGFIFGFLMKAFKRFTVVFGLLLMGAAFLISSFAGNLPMVYIGSVICGIAFSCCFACIFDEVGSSVAPAAASIALAIATCLQNFGMFLSPRIAEAVSKDYSFHYIFGAIVLAALGVICIVFMIVTGSKKKA